jgi:pimeloyl-ACP methyl ester carboxylesterase
MGCQVAVELAVRRPKLARALVLVGPTVDPAARSRRLHFARLAVDALREPLALNAIVTTDYVRAGPLRTLASARRMVEHRIEERLPLVTQPAVVVRGERDPIVPQSWGEHAAALLPKGRLEVVPRAPHAAHWTHPAQVAAAARSVA